MKTAIVTFQDGAKDIYVQGQKRQEESLRAVGFDGDYFAFTSYEEIGSPHHEDVPYAFKPYAINTVVEKGYDLILWIDSPIYATQPLDQVFTAIEHRGVLLFDNIGFSIGDYTSDECLRLARMSRDEAFRQPMIMACCMGFDLRNQDARDFFFHYLECARIPGYYEGDWNNKNGQVSSDLRVKGHRHDQSVASILAAKKGIRPLIGHETYFTYFDHPGMMPVAPSVCLYSGGL